MRKISTIVLFLFLVIGSLYSQTTLNLTGNVLDMGIGVPNQEVYIDINSSQNGGFSLNDTIYTDSSGFFSSNPTLPSGITWAYVIAQTLDCSANSFSADTGSYNVGNVNVSLSINFCPNGNTCNTTASHTVAPNLAVFFSSTANGVSPYTYNWDFGDGATDNTQNPQHVYNSSGLYNVSLATSDANGCLDTVYQTVSIDTCNAAFTYTDWGFGQTAFHTDLVVNANAAYSWDFGDGGTSSAKNSVFHTYALPGTYQVCLTVNDSISGCMDTFCDSVLVNFVIPNCTSAFTASPSPGTNTAQFTNNSQGNNGGAFLYYTWDFGDGGNSNLENPSHTYNAFGTYNVCLSIFDSVFNCNDYFCDSVTVTGPGTCNASFTTSINGLDVQLTNYSTGSPGFSFDFQWDFGDGNTSTLEAPTHTYTSPGVYSLCLTVTDTAISCSDIMCKNLIIQNVGTYAISGGVSADSNSVNNGLAYLIVHDSVSGTLTAIDTVNINQGAYLFINVNPGNYLIKTSLLPASPYYANTLPTYFGNELNWSNATSVVVSNANVGNPRIYMIPGSNPGGPGFIGGLISQGANKGPGDPLSGVSVLLLDDAQEPIAHALTDLNGEFGFSNLPLGNYEVYVEIPGKVSVSWMVTLNSDSLNFDMAYFEVGDSAIVPVTATSIEDFSFGKILSVYPNPTTDQLFIDMEISRKADLNIELLNSLGQVLQRRNELPLSGNQTITMNTAGLSAGTYLLKISSGEQIITKKIFKR